MRSVQSLRCRKHLQKLLASSMLVPAPFRPYSSGRTPGRLGASKLPPILGKLRGLSDFGTRPMSPARRVRRNAHPRSCRTRCDVSGNVGKIAGRWDWGEARSCRNSRHISRRSGRNVVAARLHLGACGCKSVPWGAVTKYIGIGGLRYRTY